MSDEVMIDAKNNSECITVVSNANAIISLDYDANDKNVLNDGEPIVLNVGGKKYYTSLNTLLSDSNSILCKMFEGKFALKPIKDGSYFIDRDGEHFGYILNYLRNNTLNIPDDINLIYHLTLEAKYYQLASFRYSLYWLLVKKLNSKILSSKDMEFICNSLINEYPNGINIEKCSLIHRGDTYPKYEKLQGMDRLLMLFHGKDNRFGFYLDSKYHREEDPNSCVLDLNSRISGKLCVCRKSVGYPFTIRNFSDPDIETIMRVEVDCNRDMHQENDECNSAGIDIEKRVGSDKIMADCFHFLEEDGPVDSIHIDIEYMEVFQLNV
eukprot:457245_1